MQTITTTCGDLIPQHTDDDLRKKEILPIEYHENGTPKSVPLETQTTISTPAGDLPAELITFHENGTINRVFPLNGKLSGYWSQEDEAALAKPAAIATPIGVVKAKLLSVSFYDTGILRSLTLWPDEALSLRTPAGVVETRIGVSFHPDGTLRSIEPARPTSMKTPMGEIQAFDPDAIGVNGDANSLVFNNQGEIVRITTTLTRLSVITQDGCTRNFTPETRESLCSEAEKEVVPMTIAWNEQTLSIYLVPDTPPVRLPREGIVCLTEPYLPHTPRLFEISGCAI